MFNDSFPFDESSNLLHFKNDFKDLLLASLFDEWCEGNREMMRIMQTFPPLNEIIYFSEKYSSQRKNVIVRLKMWILAEMEIQKKNKATENNRSSVSTDDDISLMSQLPSHMDEINYSKTNVNKIKYSYPTLKYITNDLSSHSSTKDKQLVSYYPSVFIDLPLFRNEDTSKIRRIDLRLEEEINRRWQIKLSSTRYHQDFFEIERVGKGGFGSVYKVFHKVDRKIYAIKKIKHPINHDYLITHEAIKHDTVIADIVQHRVSDKSNSCNFGPWSDSENNIIIDENNLDSEEDKQLMPYNSEEISNSEFSDKNNDYDLNHVLNEVRILSSLEHPNIIRYYFSWIETSISFVTLYIQMEYQSHTLREILQERNYSLDKDQNLHLNQCLQWSKDLASALQIIHSKKIIHRDLSSNNVFVSYKNNKTEIERDNPLKIGDFGLSLHETKIRKSQRYLENCQGQELYTAPEVQKDFNQVSFESDIYSLGLIFIEIWVRFQSEMERIITLKNPNQIEQLNIPTPFIKNIIQKMCHKNPENRPKIKQVLKELNKI
jgi:serine/threonine protein kinase